ncbi:cysteine synthase A [Streptomyces sodiiphilus]|uniref:Cysteine synthase A n=1 Tax=Streptomyces sodiiphilus TaxID=226217 RepID=A0ABN2NVU4_9ACTN
MATRPPVADSLQDLIGETPLLRLRLPGARPGTTVLAKLEAANPLSSVKDRTALWMLRAAMRCGALPPAGGTVVEATSGNTGIALAALSASLGHRCIIVLADNATPERIALLRALGAEIVFTPGAEGTRGAIEEAERVHLRTPGSWFARQHENDDNVRAHRESTGPEIWRATGGRIDTLVCGVGTGGTLTGIAQYLRKQAPGIRIVAVEPADSPVLSQGIGGQHRIPGLNGGFVAGTTDVSLIDQVITVSNGHALNAARAVARRHGILAGISAGAAAHACTRLAAQPEYAGRTIVTLFPDSGERYLSMWDTPAEEDAAPVPAVPAEAGAV